jgi:hypothetical protein
MLEGYPVVGKNILEPSAGSGAIVDFCIGSGAASVIACEKDPNLREIVKSKCKVIKDDFLDVTAEMISHVDMIVMNPPFSADETHIMHAFNIAPAGCTVIALCNYNTLRYVSNRHRVELSSLIDKYGHSCNLGSAFDTADRSTGVDIGLVILSKPAEDGSFDYSGFFMDEEPEADYGEGIIKYDFIRDVVNRYVGACKIFERQIDLGIEMNRTLSGFYNSKRSFSVSEDGAIKTMKDFKRDLQKSAWNFVLQKMNMDKYTTQGLKSDLNKFVEHQSEFPFTMANIYKMLEIIVGTHSQRMDKAIMEVFDKLTYYSEDNRYTPAGWKSNSHYMLNKLFILPYVINKDYGGKMGLQYNGNYNLLDDMTKALCHITATNYDTIGSLYNYFNRRKPQDEAAPNVYGRAEYYKLEFSTWYEWGFFEFKGYKKGTIHLKFKDPKVWELYNKQIARIKGYGLFESKK